MKKIITRVSLLATMIIALILPYFVFADNPMANNLQKVGNNAGFFTTIDNTALSGIAGIIVNSVLGLLGVIFIVLIIYSGIMWMTAGGDEAKVEQAQKILRNAIIGLIITVGVVAIFQIFTALVRNTLT